MGRADPSRGQAVIESVKKPLRRLRADYRQLTARLRGWPSALIIGAQKGGTTSLFNYLVRHPDVLPPLGRPSDKLPTSAPVGEGLPQSDQGQSLERSRSLRLAPGSWILTTVSPRSETARPITDMIVNLCRIPLYGDGRPTAQRTASLLTVV